MNRDSEESLTVYRLACISLHMRAAVLVFTSHVGRLPGRWYQLVMDNLDDVAIIMTAESGKPLKESKVEATGG